MSYQVKQGNIFGRIGEGLGKGLAEQAPKELERHRLAGGLKQFEQESSNLTPLQQYTKLAAIPGITPEHLYTIVPLLRQQMQREEGARGKGGEVTKKSGTPPELDKGPSLNNRTRNIPFAEAGGEAGGKPSLKSLEATKAQIEPIIRKSQEDLYNEAAEESRKRPGTFPTPADALNFVTANENTRIANLEEQRKVGETADVLQNRLKSGLEKFWNKSNFAKDIPGTIQNKLLQQIEADLADPNNKLSEQQLIQKYGRVGDDVGRDEGILEDRAQKRFLSGDYTPEKIRNTISQTQKSWKEAGSLEEFKDKLIDKFNMSEPVANYFAMPPENRTANKIINYFPKIKTDNNGLTSPIDVTRGSIELADKLSSLLTDDDSVLSYAMSIKKNGLDPKQFIDRIKQNQEVGLFKASKRQSRELAEGIPFVPALGDIYISNITGRKDLVE